MCGWIQRWLIIINPSSLGQTDLFYLLIRSLRRSFAVCCSLWHSAVFTHQRIQSALSCSVRPKLESKNSLSPGCTRNSLTRTGLAEAVRSDCINRGLVHSDKTVTLQMNQHQGNEGLSFHKPAQRLLKTSRAGAGTANSQEMFSLVILGGH